MNAVMHLVCAKVYVFVMSSSRLLVGYKLQVLMGKVFLTIFFKSWWHFYEITLVLLVSKYQSECICR